METKSKNGFFFFTWLNMALTNLRFKDQIGLNLGEETVEKKRRREGEKKEKRKRKRKEGDQASQDQEV